jgi:hypothetical protein
MRKRGVLLGLVVGLMLVAVEVSACADRARETPLRDNLATESPDQASPPAEGDETSSRPCNGDRPVDTSGLFQCDDGRVHRPAVVECPSTIEDDDRVKVDPGFYDPDDLCCVHTDGARRCVHGARPVY